MDENKTAPEESTNSLPKGDPETPDNGPTEESSGQDTSKEVTPGSPGPMGGGVPAQGRDLLINLKDIFDDIKKDTDTLGAGIRSLLKAPIFDNPTKNASITKAGSDILTAASNIGLAGGLIDNAIDSIQKELEPAGSNTGD